MQWGNVTTPLANGFALSFPVSFNSVNYAIVGSAFYEQTGYGNDADPVCFSANTKKDILIYVNDVRQPFKIVWIAIGV